MLTAQNGHCAVCPATRGNSRRIHLFVDHNHVTGKVRGLLCGTHNTQIGIYEAIKNLAEPYLNRE